MQLSRECVLVLHAARVKGAAGSAALAVALGWEGVDEEIELLITEGLVSRHGAGPGALIVPTDAGREVDRRLIEAELPGTARERLAALYERSFLPVNVEFKQLCAEWQTTGHGFELLEAVIGVHERIEVFLAAAAELSSRLERYCERLAAAAERVQDGELDALVAPVGESYHNIWFELHEDLIVTLGRTRAEEGE